MRLSYDNIIISGHKEKVSVGEGDFAQFYPDAEVALMFVSVFYHVFGIGGLLNLFFNIKNIKHQSFHEISGNIYDAYTLATPR